MGKIKAGVIGVGYLGRFHAQKYAALEDAELIGVVDLDARRAWQVADECQTQAFTDFRELLPLVQVVSVAAPTIRHYELVQECLRHNIDVLAEKPLATTVAEAEELVQLARQKGRILQVGHLERFNPATEELTRRVRDPRFIEIHRLAFFKERGTDVDVVRDLMIHDLDLILSLVPGKVREIRAAGVSVLTDSIDLANARLEFDSGCIANLTASRISVKSMRKFRLFQPHTYLSVDFETRELMVVEQTGQPGGILPGIHLETLKFPPADPLMKEIAAFLEAVVTRREPVVSGEAGKEALALALDINTAMRQAHLR
ncbi:Gfo/Idh/MocA family protein [Desulfobacca acetoxidans]|uniref:Oxidoreductase domain protein n=1 Tax=Desulfobacca acetoxidans (strain ATCC 700848 / DSM 11109 / ASRB2) TaxID=880072 RepID=F2NCI5_DESAR|nr:Gfo/Idh/MocA family oxidoreductase [Desulfobacca acetoxidans]AEB09119.1 oxidoreductase domain protein [Desulfobacca acetoxidans DSM 11109]